MSKVQASKTWLFWTGLLLAGLALVVIVGSGLETSRAQTLMNGAVEVSKTVNMPSCEPGHVPAPLYTITFTNTTASEVILDSITDTLPDGFKFVDMHPLSDWQQRPEDDEEPEIVWQGPIAIPADGTLSLVYAVDTFGVAPSAAPFVNTVEAVTSGADPVGPASAQIRLGRAELDVHKGASPMRIEGLELVTYTVTFSNTGHLSGTLETITDDLDPVLDFERMAADSDISDLPGIDGDKLTWTGPYEVPPLDALTLRYVVRAPEAPSWIFPSNQIKADTGDELLGPAGIRIVVGPEWGKCYIPMVHRDFMPAHLTVAKSASPTEFTTTDGEDVTYTLTIENVGDTTGQLTSVHDVLPEGFGFLGMAAGSDVGDPDVAGRNLTWPSLGMDMAPGSTKVVIYRASHSTTEGQYTNSATVTALGASVPAAPATAAVTVEKGILLEENFESGIGLWTPFLNYGRQAEGQWYWGLSDGFNGTGGLTMNRYAVEGKDAEDGLMMYLQPGAEEWTDYQMEAKIIFRTDGHPSGLWVRGQWEPSDIRAQWVTGYYIMIGGSPGANSHYVRLLQLQTLEDCWGPPCPSSPEYKEGNEINLYNFNNPHELEEVKGTGELHRYQWHTVKVEVRGDNIQIWLNGNKYIDYTDSKEPFLTGTVGFKTYKADTVSYDDIVVTPLQPLE